MCVWERAGVFAVRYCVVQGSANVMQVVCCVHRSLNCLISKCQTFKWLSHLDLFIHLGSIRCRRCCCMLQLPLHGQMRQWIINHSTKRSNQRSVNAKTDCKVNLHGVYSRHILFSDWNAHAWLQVEQMRSPTVIENLNTHIQIQSYHRYSQCCQCRGIGATAHMLFSFFVVRLNNGAFGSRWLTPTH